jgi:hypothetical protein
MKENQMKIYENYLKKKKLGAYLTIWSVCVTSSIDSSISEKMCSRLNCADKICTVL